MCKSVTIFVFLVLPMLSRGFKYFQKTTVKLHGTDKKLDQGIRYTNILPEGFVIILMQGVQLNLKVIRKIVLLQWFYGKNNIIKTMWEHPFQSTWSWLFYIANNWSKNCSIQSYLTDFPNRSKPATFLKEMNWKKRLGWLWGRHSHLTFVLRKEILNLFSLKW